MSGSTSVYRLYGIGWRLLYIGCSEDNERRMWHHRHMKDWWGEVVHKRVKVYPSRERALAVEKRAISILKPVHNVKDKKEPK